MFITAFAAIGMTLTAVIAAAPIAFDILEEREIDTSAPALVVHPLTV